jgi:hypothetical protein
MLSRVPLAVPVDPGEFFERFFPEQFTRHRERFPEEDSPGSAVFEIMGVDCWGVKIAAGDLVVRRGKPDDTLLRCSVSPEDFQAVFVERTQREAERTGRLSEDSLGAFRPLFLGARKAHVVGDARETLNFKLDHEAEKRRLLITPGPGEPTEPKATITMALADFLQLVGGRAHPAMLFMRGKLRVRGDLSYALRMSKLVS